VPSRAKPPQTRGVVQAASPNAAHGPVRVLIVDADHRVRGSLAEVVALAPGVQVAGSASHLASAVALVDELRPDVVILDPRLPDLDGGIALVSVIREAHPWIRILLLTWSLEHENGRLTAAVDDIVDKCAPPEDFVAAIVAAVRPASPRPMLDSAAARNGIPVQP
jgi:DNA-binding NarL/FixJ family response regulator